MAMLAYAVNEVMETPPAFFFDASDRFHFFAQQDGAISRIDVALIHQEGH